MFEDIKSGSVVNGVKVIHVREKTAREQLLTYGMNARCREALARDYARERATKKMLQERDNLVKRMYNEYEAYKSIK